MPSADLVPLRVGGGAVRAEVYNAWGSGQFLSVARARLILALRDGDGGSDDGAKGTTLKHVFERGRAILKLYARAGPLGAAFADRGE